MEIIKLALFFVTFSLTLTSCFTSPGTYNELSRAYSPDSTKLLLSYNYIQGAWDGNRTWAVAIMNAEDSIKPGNFKYSYSSLDFDNIYWKGNDTVVIEEKYTDFISEGKSKLKDTILDGIKIKVIQRDPIDTSFTRKIFYREVSPSGKQELIVYKYVKAINGNYFLNISIINRGESIPKFGNFYISKYDFDCFTDIRWDSTNILDCKVYESCYYAFNTYLVKNRPDIKYKVQINDTIKGNIQMYMQ